MGENQNHLWYGNLNYMVWIWFGVVCLAASAWYMIDWSAIQEGYRRAAHTLLVFMAVWASMWLIDYTIFRYRMCALPEHVQNNNVECAESLMHAMEGVEVHYLNLLAGAPH